MAGDWLKIREDLHEDPAVLRMAAALETRPEHVVGYCLRFWGWVSRNVSLENRDTCPSASVVGVPILSIESVLQLPGFLPLLREVGWLEYDETEKPIVVTIPKFERHLSETAKQRALAAEKKRRQRAEKRPDSVPEKTGQVSLKNRDQRREEKRRDNKVSSSRAHNRAQAATSDRVSVLVSDCQHIAQKAFSRIGYEGHDAGMLWRAAALVSTGEISAAHFFDACEAVATTSPTNPIAYFRAALEERVPGLSERLVKVRLVPNCPHGPIEVTTEPIPRPTIAKVNHDSHAD